MSTTEQLQRTAGTGSSTVVNECQISGEADLRSVLFLGFLPPVNQMRPIGQQFAEQPAYPAEMLISDTSKLVQLGLIVDPEVLFPPEYPYTSGTTRILRENFAEMYEECSGFIDIAKDDLVVDIGANDGTLLSNFQNKHRVLGIEPTLMANLAIERGIPSIMSFFNGASVAQAIEEHGQAKIITATNVFAHIEKTHEVVDNILKLLGPGGVFINESHYLGSLVETLQYDTIYHEHLRYYSVMAQKYLFDKHGLEIIHVKKIPTHGGSIRVYATRKGDHPVRDSVAAILGEEEKNDLHGKALVDFKERAVQSKLDLYALLADIKREGGRIFGIGAPSRASTLINYVGLDDGILDCVLEIKGSYKIGKYMPGTRIPVEEESRLFNEQPEYALMLSWHIAEELIPKLKEKGFKGKFIIPLPEPRVV